MTKVLVEPRERVTLITLNRPAQHNCINGETAVSLAEAIDAFAWDDEQHVLVITGAGERAFCSGMDLRAMQSVAEHRWVYRAGPLGFARLDPGKPTIAAINGFCFAGGMELAAWCDFRIAASTAEFGGLNRRWGVPFTDGGTQHVARSIGLANALYLLESGVRIDAARAQQLGFVQEIVPEATALERALALAARIAGYPQESLRADRQATIRGLGLPAAEGLRLELDLTGPTAWSAGTTRGLERYDRGDRPAAPEPA